MSGTHILANDTRKSPMATKIALHQMQYLCSSAAELE